MPAGRPGHDRIALGKEFVEWAASTPDAFTVPQFWAVKKRIPTDTCGEWANEDKEFRRLYYMGKELIGVNRMNASMCKEGEKQPQLDPRTYLRGLRNFDHDQRRAERDEIKYEARIKAEAALKAARKLAKQQGIDLSSKEGKEHLKSVLDSL